MRENILPLKREKEEEREKEEKERERNERKGRKEGAVVVAAAAIW